MTPEEARAMPGAFTAYRRVDGELICGEYSWMGEHYDCDMDGHWAGDAATEIEEVIMVPVRVRTFPCHEVSECEHEYEDGKCIECDTAEPSSPPPDTGETRKP